MSKYLNSVRGQFIAIDAVGIVIAAALTLTLLFAVLLPLNERARQQSAARGMAVRDRQHRAALTTAGRRLQEEIAINRQMLAAAPLQMSSENALNQRLADLTVVSSDCKLQIDDLKPGDPLQSSRFVMIPLRMSGHGSYRDCATFIHSLHQRLSDVDVQSFKLARALDDSTNSAAFELQLRWFAAPRTSSPPEVGLQTAALAQ